MSVMWLDFIFFHLKKGQMNRGNTLAIKSDMLIQSTHSIL